MLEVRPSAREAPPAEVQLQVRPVALPAAIRRYTKSLARLRPGNQIAILRGGREIFPAMLRAIAAARTTINLETYILADDGTGQRFAEALIERVAAGVTVRLLYDAVGAIGLRAAYLDR